MSTKGQKRQIPNLEKLPRPLYARPESWGKEGSSTEWHHHHWGQFSYAIKGVLTVRTREGCYIAPPQFAIWIPEGIEHQVSSEDAAEMRSLYIESSALPEPSWQKPCVFEITPLCKELIIRFCQQPVMYEAQTKQSRIVDVLLDELQSQKEANTRLPMPTDERMIAICHHLQQHPDSQNDIGQLGERVQLTGRSVSRLFKAQTGITFQQWRQHLRLLNALSRLEKGDSVMSVAVDCGYDSNSAFVAAFKKQFGCTPGRYFTSRSS